MSFLKKTIILKNSGFENQMALLTIEKNNSGVFGNLKVFNFDVVENLVLGISTNGKQVLKHKVNFLNGNDYIFKLNNDFDINSKIGCVLAVVKNDDVKPLIWGANGLRAEFKNDIISVMEEDLKPTQTDIKKVESLSNESSLKPELFETSDHEIDDLVEQELGGGDFFDLIKQQIDELFLTYPQDDFLNKAFPDSKWVKVDYENNGTPYVFGLIYDDHNVKYIAYGVPGQYNVEPPRELKDYSQWLPLDSQNPFEDGYWIMYQDAKTGDSVMLEKSV